MSGGATGSCIHLNEGAGSGTSAYWAWYLATAGKTAVGPRLSYIQVSSAVYVSPLLFTLDLCTQFFPVFCALTIFPSAAFSLSQHLHRTWR